VFPKKTKYQRLIKIKKDESTGLPIYPFGKLNDALQWSNISIENRIINYLKATRELSQIENPTEEFFLQKIYLICL